MSSTSTQSSTASFSSDTADFYCNNNCVIRKVNLSFTKIGKDSYQKSKPTFIENWKNLTSRPTTIKNDNFFVCTGKVSGITIVDVDRKNNKDGFAELKRVGIEMKDYKNICASIKTPSGMRHYVFKYDERLTTGANVYGLGGVDIRNDDGVVFAGKHYCVLSVPEQLGRIPDDLYEKLCNRMILCNLLEDKWFNDFDKWVKIGYALYNESSMDKDVALNTWLKLIEDRSDKFNQIECLRIWDRQSEDEKYKVSMGTIVNSVSQTNKEAYEQWRKQYYKHKGKSSEKVNTFEDEFESTFDSARNKAEVENMLIQMNKTFEDFKLAMCDDSFERFTEISHWCKDYCVITNSVDHTFNNDFRIFENMLKTLKFNSREIALRFIAYFIHEFHIFLTTNNRLCYIKSKSIDGNTSVLKEYDITAFKAISVHYENEEKLKKTTLSDLLTQLPIHKFDNTVCVLEDQFTVLKVNPERKDDRCFYGKLRSDMVGEETSKFITYLKRFTTSMPMPIHKTKEYESMLSNASESIVQYLSDLKESLDDVHFTNKCDKHYHISKNMLFDHYTQWCSRNNEKPLTFLKFKHKLIHYDSTILYKKMKLNDVQVWGFEFPFFVSNRTE
ncbi:unnamed protein product [Phytophthora lilii]|uniref:Unnamed protein product n=1 Tax=Phytophthora lilii TaxID=2077276 RepID=A0A9W6U5D2_9STRA|nr:unnamed protein product [Phytophthora lilii]